MKHIHALLLCVIALLITADLLRPQPSRAGEPARVYVQEAREKKWTDLQGSEVVGFSCAPEIRSNGGGGGTTCYVASR